MLGELLEAKCSLAGPCKPLVLWRRWSPSSFGGFFFTNPTGCSQKRLGTSWRCLHYDVRLRKGKSSPCNRDKMCCLDPSPLSVLRTRSVHLWGDERQKVSPSRPTGDLPLYLEKWKRKNIWSQGRGAGTMWTPGAWQVPKRPQPGAQHQEAEGCRLRMEHTLEKNRLPANQPHFLLQGFGAHGGGTEGDDCTRELQLSPIPN